MLLLEHLNAAIRSYQQALDLIPADDQETRAISEHQLGDVYGRAGDTGQALRHYQQAIQHEEARGDIFGAGQTRYNIALLLAERRPDRRRAALRARRPGQLPPGPGA